MPFLYTQILFLIISLSAFSGTVSPLKTLSIPSCSAESEEEEVDEEETAEEDAIILDEEEKD